MTRKSNDNKPPRVDSVSPSSLNVRKFCVAPTIINFVLDDLDYAAQ